MCDGVSAIIECTPGLTASELKAFFLLRLPQFVTWPDDQVAQIFCVAEASELSQLLEEMLADEPREPVVRVLQSTETMTGCDAALLVPNPQFPYPAPVTNPSAFGGERVDLTVFVRFPFADGRYTEASYAGPLYLDLNGPQSSEKYHFSIEIGASF